MKTRIEEALRRRHRKGDEGFTLIELLVVILIIAILAAVGIIALLAALNAGRKSAATTTLRNAITAVQGVRTGIGAQDFTGVTVTAAGDGTLQEQEPDITFRTTALTPAQTTNNVGATSLTANQIVMHSRNATDCFYVELNVASATRYAREEASGNCPSTPSAWNTDQTAGWNE